MRPVRQVRLSESVEALVDQLRHRLDPDRAQEIEIGRRERRLARLGVTLPASLVGRSQVSFDSKEQLDLLDQVEAADLAFAPRHSTAEISHERPIEIGGRLRSELGDLAVFAALPDNLPASVAPLARLIALRVFGGWTLERIAEHDRRAVSDVLAMWQDAKAWLSRNSEDAENVGNLFRTPQVSDHVLSALRDAPQLLHVVEWRHFERILSRILETLGYEVELQRGTKDGGIDVVAIKHSNEFGPHRYLVQAKRTARRIGVEPVRELLFLKNEYQATKACLATTSSFTAGAWRLADEHRWELELRDFDRLREWLDLLRHKS